MATTKKEPIDDVAKPGKTPADATARPIITGHAILKDPMVTKDTSEDDETPAETPKEILAPSAAKKVIQPLSVPESAEAEKPAEEVKPTETTPDDTVTDNAVVDAVIEQVSDKKKADKASEEEQKRQEIADKLVEEKKYFLPISNTAVSRNNKIILLLLGALLPVIVGLGLAADAGAINLGFKVPFDFIKDKAQPAVTTPAAPVSTATKPTASTTTVLDTSAASTTKDYTDSAKFYSVKYPSNWTAELSQGGTDGPVPDFTKVSRGVTFVYPKAETNMGVTVDADSTGSLLKEIQDNWKNNKHTPVAKTINGYAAQYVQVVFKGDAESYTDDQYLITKGNTTVYMTFREKYYHQYPAANWDASKAMPGFTTILNSIKILK